jgi:DNA replication protein
MKGFSGFSDGPSSMTPLPEAFFTDLLPQMDQVDELKLTLFLIWRLAQQEGKFRFITARALQADPLVQKAMPMGNIADALERAIARGIFIAVQHAAPLEETYYFLNSQRGRAAAKGLADGVWNPAKEMPLELPQVQRPNIFTLYEQNIGPLTPIVADLLRTAAEEYSDQEVTAAITAAVGQNARTWRYIEAVLEGRASDAHSPGSDNEERKKYVEGKYSDFIEH